MLSFAAPGNIDSIASPKFCPPIVISLKAGQVKSRSAAPRVSKRIWRGTSIISKTVDRELGDRVLRTSKTKQRRLLPSSRVWAFRTPPVKSFKSTPVKLSTVPVLPPMLDGIVSSRRQMMEWRNSPAKLGVLCNKVENIEIQLNQGIVNGNAIPVFWDPFPALVVGEIAWFSLYREEALDNILG